MSKQSQSTAETLNCVIVSGLALSCKTWQSATMSHHMLSWAAGETATAEPDRTDLTGAQTWSRLMEKWVGMNGFAATRLIQPQPAWAVLSFRFAVWLKHAFARFRLDLSRRVKACISAFVYAHRTLQRGLKIYCECLLLWLLHVFINERSVNGGEGSELKVTGFTHGWFYQNEEKKKTINSRLTLVCCHVTCSHEQHGIRSGVCFLIIVG